jgi:magnesium transporter
MRSRRDSRPTQPYWDESYNRQQSSYFPPILEYQSRRRGSVPSVDDYARNQDDDNDFPCGVDDRTPLMRETTNATNMSASRNNYGTGPKHGSRTSINRPPSDEAASSHRGLSYKHSPVVATGPDRDYDVNNPPSVPASPGLDVADIGYNDTVVTGADFALPPRSPELFGSSQLRLRDAIINMDGSSGRRSSPGNESSSTPQSPLENRFQRRRTVTLPVEEDVCFPTELADADFSTHTPHDEVQGERRRRHRREEWPDLSVLEEWSREEKEERSGEFRVKKISEPVLVGGRLRPQYASWRREEEDAPYRFTYFNEDFPSTIHAQSISELVQPGGSFRELFIPDPLEMEDSSDEEDEDLISFNEPTNVYDSNNRNPPNNVSVQLPNAASPFDHNMPRNRDGRSHLSAQIDIRSDTDVSLPVKAQEPKPKRYGPRPTWWLDVICPTDSEMRVIAKAFGIHALTAEDIMMQEAREKVELFRNYYFLNYRTFEQDSNRENYLDPVNMCVVVFREGLLSFHFSQTPHPANVRRRIRQLRDYLILSSDWICYALIDDITDVFGPLIHGIENEVDEIDDTIMEMQSGDARIGGNQSNPDNDVKYEKDEIPQQGGRNMLRRVGICRKKVMGMFRLLNTKADVIKGFAKRCNEQWEVAPKSEIGLYLGDIQDHIMTMTSNLSHYETYVTYPTGNAYLLDNI